MTGSNKKMNFPIIKQIRLNEQQALNWNAKAIRSFLDKNSNDFLEVLREMFENGVLKVYKNKMNEKYLKCLEML